MTRRGGYERDICTPHLAISLPVHFIVGKRMERGKVPRRIIDFHCGGAQFLTDGGTKRNETVATA